MSVIIQKIREGKFQDPKQSSSDLKEYFNSLCKEIEVSFNQFNDA
jgi:hypothetical protein